MNTNISRFLEVSPEVAAAVRDGKPVIALESTIISHGMPYPKNVETALEVERIARERGAVPATIAVIGGKMRVGLTPEEIDHLGRKGLDTIKVSRRDLPTVCAMGEDGATTVAATMIIANLAGIEIFATGGVGGVHRGAETNMDISADLEELSKTPVLVVCAGAKSILDIGLTMEYLETKGVSVFGYQTNTLPAFYTRESDFKVNTRIENPRDMAAVVDASKALGLGTGAVLANPIPTEYSMDRKLIDQSIASAIQTAEELGIKGKDITPFLLDTIQKITDGKSLEANIQLVYNNVRLACEIAKELSAMRGTQNA